MFLVFWYYELGSIPNHLTMAKTLGLQQKSIKAIPIFIEMITDICAFAFIFNV